MTKRAERVLAWHCINTTRTLGYGDGRKVVAGKTLTVKRPDDIALCNYGLHASERLIDALSHAREPIVCRVELSGNVLHGDDKLVASKRKCLWIVDATHALRLWACWCAERALKLERKAGREPDARSWKAIEVTSKYLNGKAQVDELIAAQNAAAYAADAAADAAYAAYAADAAADAADGAYAAAARKKESDAQNRKLEAMVAELHRSTPNSVGSGGAK